MGVHVAAKITHPDVSQLTIKLTSPDGTEITLRDQTGSGPNLDEIFRPSSFNGESVTGDWEIKAIDNIHGDSGSLARWSIDVEWET